MSAEKDKPKRGRPKKFVDLEMVERLAAIQCTMVEIASTLGVSVDTLQRHKDFAVIYKRGAEGGRKSLRRMQFESASKGNVTMQIWLGKQYLGQSDHGTLQIHQTTPNLRMSMEEFDTLIAGEPPEIRRLFQKKKAALDVDYSVVPAVAALLPDRDSH